MPKEMLSKNFARAEFACHCGCGFDAISQRVVDVVQAIRTSAGHPVRINSGCRCAKRNSAIGGVKNSDHMKGNAADISCAGLRYKKFRDIVLVVASRFEGVYVIPYDDQKFCHVGWRKK